MLTCEQDASCSSIPEENAVARYDFISGAVPFACTGTLLNDQASDDAPYFLTANHCISSDDEARTVELFWSYRTTACNSGQLMESFRSTPTGATLLANDRPSDSALLSVIGALPTGVVFSGWDPNPRSASTAVFGLHHPGGGLPPDSTGFLRIANGNIADSSAICADSGLRGGYTVNWTSGLIEPGSSGSGIWATDNGVNHLIGVASCGPSTPSCDMTGPALYGRFSDFYPKIQQFLASGPGCTFSLSNTSQAFGYFGGTGSVAVVASPMCAWRAAVSDSWIAITSGGSGAGNGIVTFAVAANPSSSSRSATITIGGSVLTITEATNLPAHNGELALDGGVPSTAVGTGGGTLFGVNRLTPDAYPATITAVEIAFRFDSGVSDGQQLNIVVGANAGGSPDIDGVSLRTISAIISTGSGYNTIPVPPMTINGGDFVVGLTIAGEPGVFPLAVDRFTAPQHRSYVSLDGRRFVILDDLGPTFAGNLLIRALVNEGTGTCGGSITPTQQQFASSGGMATVNLTTGSCAWTASTTANWITVNPLSGNGSGSVSLTIQPNTAGGARAAAVTIAGQTFLVTESPGDTKPSISSLSADLNG
ncbi:MAG: BACON domain-containing protein, partial [Blastocatellia bacterium]